MSLDRTVGRRQSRRRAFRPTLDGGLESRIVLGTLPGSFFLSHPKPGFAYLDKQPPLRLGTHAHRFPVAPIPRGPRVATETAHGGASVIVGTPDGSAVMRPMHHPPKR